MDKIVYLSLVTLIIGFLVVSFSPEASSGQKSTYVTLYQGGPAQVVTNEKVKLYEGLNKIKKEFSEEVIKSTVFVDPDGGYVKRIDFNSATTKETGLLENYLGEDIVVTTPSRTITGRLLSIISGHPLLQIDNKNTVLIKNSREFRLDNRGLPRLTNQLEITIQSKKDRDVRLTHGYQMRGLSWEPKYNGFINEEEEKLQIVGVAHISNTTDQEFGAVNLNLMAGSPSSEETASNRFLLAKAAEASPTPEPEKVFEYYRYPIKFPVEIQRNSTMHTVFLRQEAVSYTKEYQFTPSSSPAVKTTIKTVNEEKMGLGLPIAAGTMRIYRKDEARSFLGADRIDNTPVGEEIELDLGSTFDIKGNKTRKEHNKLGEDTWEDVITLELTNRKTKEITVQVVDKLSGDWEILDSNTNYKVISSNRIRFTPEVGPDSSVTIRYRVRYSY